jgi:LmbE family N-acetylglucosaminyl deacetylase
VKRPSVATAPAAVSAVADPSAHLAGPVLVVAPHVDDETLGCGGTIALLSAQVAVHVLYAADGRLSPSGPDGGPAAAAATLPAIRRAEAEAAMQRLGVPAERLHFLALPDGALAANAGKLEQGLRQCVAAVAPRTVLAPFRHDQHPDHIAVYRATRAALGAVSDIDFLEYFVYYRYPLLVEQDIRRAVEPRHLLAIDIDAVRERKRSALEDYPSQVTRFYPWQQRPVLTAPVLDDHCAGPELFVRAAATMPTGELFARDSVRLRINLHLGPQIVRWKKRFLG